jgi:3-oxoacyl-[acyl-carrier protein] reductase
MAQIDRVALVTGASSGLGWAIARRLASDGWTLGLIARRGDRLEALRRDIGAAKGTAHVYAGDIRDTPFLEGCVADIVSRAGRIDLLVNNAGSLTETAEYVTDAMIDAALALNVRAGYRLALLTLPHLEATRGSIVNIGSAAVARNFGVDLPYVAAKGALEAISRVMAKLWGPRGVRVNVVSPGVVETEALANTGLSSEAQHQRYVDLAATMQTIQRRGQPDDIASAVAYLASQEAAFITGALLQVDGGVALGG